MKEIESNWLFRDHNAPTIGRGMLFTLMVQLLIKIRAVNFALWH